MYTRQEASKIRQEFWTAFGRYMQPVLSSEGQKINWINYKTGAKHIAFRMNAGSGAVIAIEISHPDLQQQNEYFERFMPWRKLFEEMVGNDWTWQQGFTDEHGKVVSRIYTTLEGVHLFNKADWPVLISFFKPRMIALDAFWNEVKPAFDVWQ